ncbi:MAG: PDZ domain-containing protein, partial [Bacteroidales bacterium]|nr:PDZ domain-containing protein [Bacteroidales bacterium]
MKKIFLLTTLFLGGMMVLGQTAEETLLLRSPSVSPSGVCFAYGGDIWTADKNGNYVQRLTVHPGVESRPMFSPDGKWVAFSGSYEGNTDVYVVPTEGGMPKRITYHPSTDILRGWKGNGELIFASSRESNSGRYTKLFTVEREGSLPQAMPIPEAHQGKVSPQGGYTAYIKNPDPSEGIGTYRPFKHYRGGNTPKIWIFNNATYEIEEIPPAGSNNTHPVWTDEQTVWFLSDRNGYSNIFRYDRQSGQVSQITSFEDFPVKNLYANGPTLAFEQGGRVHLYDVKQQSVNTLHIKVNPDIPYKRAHYEEGRDYIRQFDLSPTGVRAVMGVRGDIFTIPAEKGDIRNITESPGTHDRFPAWSPDGQKIAWFCDATGEYRLMINDQKGAGEPSSIAFEDPSFYHGPWWSPDSKKLVFYDKHLNLYYLDLNEKQPVQIDRDIYANPMPKFTPDWSPDSKWITYTRRLENQLSAVFVYNVETGRRHQVTDGMSEATYPTFGAEGKYLFFAASTDFGLNASWLDMSNYPHRVTSSLYAAVLQKDEPSPFAPESDEEEPEKKKEEKEKQENDNPEDKKVQIDFQHLDQRIVSLPVPTRSYSELEGAVSGKLLYREDVPDKPGYVLHAFDMEKKEDEIYLDGIRGYSLSANGKKMIYASLSGDYAIVDATAQPEPGKGTLNLSGMKVHVVPEKEWQQMFDELWRIERDYFYVENMHGVDWKAVKAKYGKFLPHVGHREDLNYLFAMMMGEMVVGHNYVGGGDMPEQEGVQTGLLGADYEVVNNRYRIKKIYSGLNWNPSFKAPLTQPGVDVSEGDYILEVDGEPLTAEKNIYSLFQHTVGKQVNLKVHSEPTLEGARQVTVVPVESERNLRNMNWVEGNRKKVNEMTDGRVAYVYMPNTGQGGYTFFNRYYFSQLDKEAVIIDERFNGGGSAADYVINLLDRQITNYWGSRDGKVSSTPGAGIFGPKAMIINEYAASGGDLMPFLFKQKELGPLVGQTTLGILVGIYGYPTLMDGGYVTAPRFGIFSKDGEWIIENEGVHPDVEVE